MSLFTGLRVQAIERTTKIIEGTSKVIERTTKITKSNVEAILTDGMLTKSNVKTILTDGTPNSVRGRSLNASSRRICYTAAANNDIQRIFRPLYLPAGNASGGL